MILTLKEAELLLFTFSRHKSWYIKIKDDDLKLLYEMIVEYARELENKDLELKKQRFKTIENYWIILI